MPSSELSVASVQMDVHLGELETNLARIEERAREAFAAGARLIVFPECALTGYCLESREEAAGLAEPLPGPSTERLARLCGELGDGVLLAVGLLESDGDRIFNAVAIVGADGLVGSYRKVHLPHVGVDRFIDPGDRPFEVIDTPLGRLGVNICYDGGFPEPTRILALAGAELVILPTNWPRGAEEFALHVLNARALENTIFTLSADRVGEERGTRFIGLSRICGPSGATLAAADETEETILHATIDLERARDKRIERVPGLHVIDRLADRRPEFYGDLVRPSDEAPTS